MAKNSFSDVVSGNYDFIGDFLEGKKDRNPRFNNDITVIFDGRSILFPIKDILDNCKGDIEPHYVSECVFEQVSYIDSDGVKRLATVINNGADLIIKVPHLADGALKLSVAYSEMMGFPPRYEVVYQEGDSIISLHTTAESIVDSSLIRRPQENVALTHVRDFGSRVSLLRQAFPSESPSYYVDAIDRRIGDREPTGSVKVETNNKSTLKIELADGSEDIIVFDSSNKPSCDEGQNRILRGRINNNDVYFIESSDPKSFYAVKCKEQDKVGISIITQGSLEMVNCCFGLSEGSIIFGNSPYDEFISVPKMHLHYSHRNLFSDKLEGVATLARFIEEILQSFKIPQNHFTPFAQKVVGSDDLISTSQLPAKTLKERIFGFFR